MAPSEKTIKRLFAMSGNCCAFIDCHAPIVEPSGTVTGQICHIHAQNELGPRFDSQLSTKDLHGFDNLLLLCGRHHTLVDAEPARFPAALLRMIKQGHEALVGREEQTGDLGVARTLLAHAGGVAVSNRDGNVVVQSPGAIVAGSVTLKSSKQKVVIGPPTGAIGANGDQSRYVQYLINRYNEFASKDTSRTTKFSYGALSKNIEARFGAQWKLLNEQKFLELCAFLQGRIKQTRIAKLNISKGQKVFSTFDEHRAR